MMDTEEMVGLVRSVARSDGKLDEVEAALCSLPELRAELAAANDALRKWWGACVRNCVSCDPRDGSQHTPGCATAKAIEANR